MAIILFLARIIDCEKHGNIQIEVDGVRCPCMYEQWGLKKNNKWQYWARCDYYYYYYYSYHY